MISLDFPGLSVVYQQLIERRYVQGPDYLTPVMPEDKPLPNGVGSPDALIDGVIRGSICLTVYCQHALHVMGLP